MTKPLLLLALTLLTACATVDRPELSSFEPTGIDNGVRTFKYRARADSLVYRVDTPTGEAERIRWLELYLTENSFCPSGYVITSRETVVVSRGIGDMHDVFYLGRCK